MNDGPRLKILTHAFERRDLPVRPGPVEKAVRELWSPDMRQRLYHPRHWADWAHLRRHYDLKEMTVAELKADFPLGRLPDCESCDDVCCTGPMRVVLLRVVDVAAFMDAGLTDHLTLEKPVFNAQELRQNVALQDLVQSEAWRTLPVLRQDETRTCSLLAEDNTCGAWPFWPLSCARFPYSLDLLRGRVFYADSCRSAVQDASRVGRARERGLIEAVVEGYNQRIRDAVLLRVAQRELDALGLGRFIRWPGSRRH